MARVWTVVRDARDAAVARLAERWPLVARGDGSVTGAESVVRAVACVKQRDRFGDRSILDGFPARLVGTLTGPPPVPGWALPPDAVATLRKVHR